MKLTSGLTLAATALALATAPAQEGNTPSPEEMAAYIKAMTPGKEHAALARLAGEWKATQKLRMVPGAPWTETPGSCRYTMALGGKFLTGVYTSSYQGMPFEGRSTIGFDNVSGEFVSTWIDNMGTGTMVTRGKGKADGSWDLTGTALDAVTKKPVTYRMATEIVSDDEHVFRMFHTKEGEEEFQFMEIAYTRVKG